MALSSKFAAVNIPTELTFAAANFNLDFSLMKVDAPKEFHGVRDALSVRRRTAAEDGQPHVTARRLGALFEAVVPPIPHLISAYGRRVSEIFSRAVTEPQNEQTAGIFSSQAGPDGTNIWAAATSGKGALAIHLLACMLARIWKSHEATSIWVELIERRRQEITDTITNTGVSELAAIMAAKQTFDRQQLASWDSSARSWLQTADSARRRQQTQLMLIISNVQLPVNPSADTYQSVIQAWKSALYAMDRLVRGIPQQVQDGAILLGISAWHLYPDMEILGDEITPVHQHDELMNHALLTIPAQRVVMEREGIFWSLPLSRMRYYSPPVVAERRLASDTSRISIDDLQMIVLGNIISQWGAACSNKERGCKFIVSLAKLTAEPVLWLEILAEAAQTFVNSQGMERKYLSKLLRQGGRRYASFLGDYNLQGPPPFFGLSSFTHLLGILSETEDKVDFLRNVAQGMGAGHHDLVIRYLRPWRYPETKSYAKREEFECASAIPRARRSMKRTHEGAMLEAKGHCRWISLKPANLPSTQVPRRFRVMQRHFSSAGVGRQSHRITQNNIEDLEELFGNADEAGNENSPFPLSYDLVPNSPDWDVQQVESDGDVLERNLPSSCATLGAVDAGGDNEGLCACIQSSNIQCLCESEGRHCSFLCHPYGVGCSNQDFPAALACIEGCPGNGECSKCYRVLTQNLIEQMCEDCNFICSDHLKEVDNWHFLLKKHHDEEETVYDFVLGDLESAAIFQRSGRYVSRYNGRANGSPATMDEIEAAIASKAVNGSKVAKYLSHWWRKSSPQPVRDQLERSFDAWIFASSLYRHMMEATIDIGAVDVPLYQARWSEELGKKSEGNTMVLARSFACIVLFESGEFNLDPSTLQGVLALSTGDSIFVASALLTDPTADTSRSRIQRVFGNLGRPEMVLLIPPSAPRIEPYDPHTWRLVNHEIFDGQIHDSFAQTSLHLSFTEFELAVDVGQRGLRDARVVLVESLISIDHRGKHVGDLDILSMFQSEKLVAIQRSCEHKIVQTTANEGETSSARLLSIDNWEESGLVSIDNWEEFLDFPDSRGIFRATGNWQARIAGAAASTQSGKRTVILPSKPCLECIGDWCHDHHLFDVLIC